MRKLYKTYEEVTVQEIEQAINNSVKQTRNAIKQLGNKFKSCNSTDNFYVGTDNFDWTEGFYTGEIWIAYELTGDELFKKVALEQVESFLERIEKRVMVNHHDMGFLYSLSCVAAYKLVGSEKGKKAALLAADNLISRFQEVGGFIQAWGELGAEDNYRLIIDCLLNLPLLYWATEVTGDEKYANVAKTHITTSLKVIMRPDYSTYHTHFFNKETGEPTYGVTFQGNRDGSVWARGQAWGVYGVALSYKYTRNPEYVDTFKKITDFFISSLPNDLVPYWDFDFTDGSTEPRDASSAAIAVCGMLEMAKYLEQEDAEYYISIAKKILKSLINNYSVQDSHISNGQLLHSTYARDSEFNGCTNRGVDECNTWGDYFYCEALIRMAKDWELYW